MSVSFLLMPLQNLRIIPGLMFWSGMLAGIVFQVILALRRRAFFKAYGVNRKRMQKPRNGLLSFCSNQEAVIADYATAGSLVFTVLAFVFTRGYGYICCVGLAATALSFCLHCIFNGRLYFHTNNQLKVRQVLEQKRANSRDKGEGENGK